MTVHLSRWNVVLVTELFVLLITAPILYLPQRFAPEAVVFASALLLLLWPWRRLRLGVWCARTPADWPVFLLFVVMLPVALWAAPSPLREEYAIPRALILWWNFSLFWVVITYGSRSVHLLAVAAAGFMASMTAIALLAPLGTAWLFKFALLTPLLTRIPAPLVGIFQGAESGFHPNQVAGTLLYALPLMIVLSVYQVRALRNRQSALRRSALAMLPTVALVTGTLIVGGVLVLTQSRGGLMGLAVALLLLLLLPQRWGWWVLLTGALLLATMLVINPTVVLDLISDAPPIEALGGLSTLGFRQEVWNTALAGLQDFPFTGMGLGTFREIAFLLYPIAINPNYNFGHAHNFFLQSALDFGIPGLIALLALYLVVFVLLGQIWRRGTDVTAAGIPIRVWALGLLASLVGQTAYSQLDAVAMGAKTNFAWWWLLALCLAMGNVWAAKVMSTHPR